MRIGEVIGRVTLSRCHPSVQGASWKLAVTLSKEGVLGANTGRSEPFIMFDELGTDDGSIIAVSDGAEASAPFYPNVKPVDAYCAALLDEVVIDPTIVAQFLASRQSVKATQAETKPVEVESDTAAGPPQQDNSIEQSVHEFHHEVLSAEPAATADSGPSIETDRSATEHDAQEDFEDRDGQPVTNP